MFDFYKTDELPTHIKRHETVITYADGTDKIDVFSYGGAPNIVVEDQGFTSWWIDVTGKFGDDDPFVLYREDLECIANIWGTQVTGDVIETKAKTLEDVDTAILNVAQTCAAISVYLFFKELE